MGFFFIALKHKRDGGFLEKGSGENLQNCVKRLLEPELFFEDCDQDINGNGDPNLSLNAVGRGAEEPFDAQVLFDPFEEQLDLPSAR